LAAEAALRAGAGLVSMVTHPGHQWLPAGPEIMCHMVTELAAIDHLLNQADTVVLGPGLGDGEWGRRIFGHCMAYEREVPMVVDADALNHLSGVALRRREWVLTPHPGEAARLLGISTAEIQADRFAAVRALSGRYGGTVVLKGNGTLVHDDAHPVGLCAAGNPGMGTAGMGDVLSGIIAALWGQGLSAANAARVGVTVHAQAGDKAARAGGERGMIASDLFPHIRRLLNPP
jgi:NAD(P)H-hydrate epimerase